MSNSNGIQEFVVRAHSPAGTNTTYSIAKFPAGPPGFTSKRDAAWQINHEAKNAADVPNDIDGGASGSCLLEERPGGPTLRGVREGGLTGAAYYVLSREGPDFVAMPISQWLSFRPQRQGKSNTLEEAETRMSQRERMAFPSANPRLAALAALGEQGKPGEDEPASDADAESDEDDRRRALARGGGGGGAARSGGAPGRVGAADAPGGGGEKVPEVQAAPTAAGERAEDWDHEEERADDDLDQGDEDAEADAEGEAGAGPPRDTSRRGSDAGSPAAGGSQERLRQLLHRSGLESDGEDGSGGAGASDSEDDADEDLDAMASGLPTRATQPLTGGEAATASAGTGSARAAEEPAPRAPGGASGGPRIGSGVPAAAATAAAATGPARGEKRKADAGGGAAAEEAAKRARTDADSADSGGVSEADIVQMLREAAAANTPMKSATLTRAFRAQLKTDEQRKAFTRTVGRVARLVEIPPGSGTKFIVLRNPNA
ncbi:hypothetical protein WJX81_005533 [Elliptochloris bilobata]|uniref:Transcription initiation factor IIF subunit alpha n=1 Tax=Elliptochloris bilobata TaxID=381761 RepID=A0AAW1RPE5_9CHLO